MTSNFWLLPSNFRLRCSAACLVFLAEPAAAAGHVQDSENGSGGEHHESGGVHRFSP